MTRDLDELEAVIRRELTALASLRTHTPNATDTMNRAVDRILNAACGYAVHHAATADTPENIRRRRLELADADPTNPARKPKP